MTQNVPMADTSAVRELPGPIVPVGAQRAAVDGTAERIKALKARDNVTNWSRLAFVWGVIAMTIAAGLGAEAAITNASLSLWWMAPVLVMTALLTGASQHQLGGVIHEGTHFLLFENKRLNELASDWLAAFAIYTSTYQYRVHHLAHHQFVNDPVRDPDIAQLHDSDHWLDFPVAHIDVVRKLATQLWLPNLMRFTLVRARYSAVGHSGNPYIDRQAAADRTPVRVGIFFAAVLPFIVSALLRWPGQGVAFGVLVAGYIATVIYFVRLPADKFPQSRLQPVISHRATAIGRMTFLFFVYGGLTLYDWTHGGFFAWNHFGLYWAAPLFTSFPLFMMIRQWVQHGNADRGRYTNTRVFLAGPLLRYAIFPFGMDYHLPHHMMASVPHYRLKALHEDLRADPQYAAKAVVIDGISASSGEQGEPSWRAGVLSVLGPRYAPTGCEATHVDTTTLDYASVTDAAAIARESAASGQGA